MRQLHRLIGALIALITAGPAGATVIINHSTSDQAITCVGCTFAVQVRLVWDGQGALQGVQTSTIFDPSVVELISNTTAPASILSFTDNAGTPGDPSDDVVTPGMDRLTTIVQAPGDPAGILRTVQYLRLDPVDPRAATTPAGRLIMTLTFKVIGAGITNISAGLANGDTGAVSDTFAPGTAVTAGWVPEPGTALLLGLGLAGLATRRDDRHGK